MDMISNMWICKSIHRSLNIGSEVTSLSDGTLETEDACMIRKPHCYGPDRHKFVNIRGILPLAAGVSK